MYQSNIFLIIRTLILFILSFGVSLCSAPFLIRILYKHKAWKKKPREYGIAGGMTPIFTKLHAEKEVNTPRMGGILIWSTVLIVTALLFLGSLIFGGPFWDSMNFVSR